MLRRIVNYLIYILFVLPIFFLLLLISNLILIRFYVINSRIGHISEDFFLYKCKKNLEKKNKKKIIIDFFAIDETLHKANIECRKLISDEVIILPFFLVKHFFFFFNIVSKKYSFVRKFLAYERNSKKDGYQYFSDKVFFKFSHDRINTIGQKFLSKKNLDINKKFICLNLWTSKHIDNVNHNHHSFRKISIKPFIKLIEYLDIKNYYIFKIGRSYNRTQLNHFSNFIDLSHDEIDDALDIFFLNNCQAYISSGTGLDHLAFALNKPMFINTPTINDYFIERPNIVYLLRPYFKKISNSKISIDEIINDFDLSFKYKYKDFQNKNILIGENSDDEILKAFKDLEYLINNNFKNSEKNKKISDKFWDLFLQAKKKHVKDYDYYKNKKILTHYSWSNIDY